MRLVAVACACRSLWKAYLLIDGSVDAGSDDVSSWRARTAIVAAAVCRKRWVLVTQSKLSRRPVVKTRSVETSMFASPSSVHIIVHNSAV